MKRRDFLSALGAAGLTALTPELAVAAAADYRKLLILIELKGGNDGFNTVVPYADPAYAQLRPDLALSRDKLIVLDERVALNRALESLMPMWQGKELAIVQGLGYPQPNLSHFRSIEIWDTASHSEEYLQQGWLTRAFAATPVPKAFSADALVVGSADLGPVSGGARAIAMQDPNAFNRQARLANAMSSPGGNALAHVLKVERDISGAARSIGPARKLAAAFPNHEFGRTVRTAVVTLAASSGIAVMRLTHKGFDTHQNQLNDHARLLRELGEGMAALKAALLELGRWDDTLVMSYAEFGRRPKQNQSGGTDHGTIAPHFVMGGKVRGGLYGHTPSLAEQDESGNLRHVIDFRELYATVLERWWGMASAPVLGGKFRGLPLV